MKYKIVELNNGKFKVFRKYSWLDNWELGYAFYDSETEAKEQVELEIKENQLRKDELKLEKEGCLVKRIIGVIKG